MDSIFSTKPILIQQTLIKIHQGTVGFPEITWSEDLCGLIWIPIELKIIGLENIAYTIELNSGEIIQRSSRIAKRQVDNLKIILYYWSILDINANDGDLLDVIVKYYIK